MSIIINECTCIPIDDLRCHCNQVDYNDSDNYGILEKHLLQDVPIEYCEKHQYHLKSKVSRRNVTLKGKCYFYSHSKSPICKECNNALEHLDWYSYFWGCHLCLKEFEILPIGNEDYTILCDHCSERRILFHDCNRRTGNFTIRKKISTKNASIDD